MNAGNLKGFNANDYDSPKFEVLPAGEYDVVIVASALKPTKAGTGQFLELTCQVLNGTYQNQKLWTRFNIDNPSPKAQAIGRGQLSEVCRAINVLNPNDSAELHDKPLKAVVKVGSDDKGNPTNEIRSFKPRHQGGQVAQQQAPQLGPANIAQPLVTQSSVATAGAPRNPFA